jgi:hypothetical protein
MGFFNIIYRILYLVTMQYTSSFIMIVVSLYICSTLYVDKRLFEF